MDGDALDATQELLIHDMARLPWFHDKSARGGNCGSIAGKDAGLTDMPLGGVREIARTNNGLCSEDVGLGVKMAD
ncbi:hypothetical protein [Cupriavidus sp. CuC1]|uniref:hypothetical protein n=1 Tax=Cupriavidus sp. CuC1 TaxID=3373131 RepID=UPI0037D1DD06